MAPEYDAATVDDGERGHGSRARGHSQAGILPDALSLPQQGMVLYGAIWTIGQIQQANWPINLTF
jgi:hypothetical protein